MVFERFYSSGRELEIVRSRLGYSARPIRIGAASPSGAVISSRTAVIRRAFDVNASRPAITDPSRMILEIAAYLRSEVFLRLFGKEAAMRAKWHDSGRHIHQDAQPPEFPHETMFA